MTFRTRYGYEVPNISARDILHSLEDVLVTAEILSWKVGVKNKGYFLHPAGDDEIFDKEEAVLVLYEDNVC